MVILFTAVVELTPSVLLLIYMASDYAQYSKHLYGYSIEIDNSLIAVAIYEI